MRIVGGYPAAGIGSVVFKEEGTGGMPEFISKLPEGEVVWGAFLVMGVDDRGSTVSRRPKYIFVKYCPPTVPAMKKAKTGGHKGAVKTAMNAAIDIEVQSILHPRIPFLSVYTTKLVIMLLICRLSLQLISLRRLSLQSFGPRVEPISPLDMSLATTPHN